MKIFRYIALSSILVAGLNSCKKNLKTNGR